MSVYVGLDVSLNSISICVIHAAGDLVWRGKSLSEPASLLAALEPHRSERVQEDTFPGRQSALIVDIGIRRH